MNENEKVYTSLPGLVWRFEQRKILHLFLIVLVSSTKTLKINQFLLLSLSLIQNKLRLSLLLFSFCLCDRMIHHSNDEFMLELQGTNSMMMITQVITESLLNPKPFFDELQAFDFDSWKLVLIFLNLTMNWWICGVFCSNLWGIGVILCLLWWPEFCYGGFCGGWNVCYGGEGFWGERENWLEFLMRCPFWNGESDTCAVKMPFYNLPCGLLGQ